MRPCVLPSVLTLLACVACQAPPGGQRVPFLDYEATVPATLEERPVSSDMRLAEYDVPRDDGTHAEVVVYYFGQGQGGSADANVARWTEQFSAPDGGPVVPHVTIMEEAAFPTTIAEFEGTYARGIGMGDPDAARADQGLVAAVVETPQGNLFLQLFGDRSAVTATRHDFLGMVGSIRPAGEG